MRLVPYLNREQYGERALVRGPHFDAKIAGTETTDRYGRVGDRYEIVDQKVTYTFRESDKMLFPRIGDYNAPRPSLYRQWLNKSKGKPTMGDNISFFWNYQMNWMYWRYFFWNFVGRQNAKQGIYAWDKRHGHWLSGVNFIDEMRLFNMSEMPEVMRNEKARNTYFFLPLIFGLIGLFYQARRSPKEFTAVLVLFLMTGIGIILYSNQPPREPRERDYVLAGSIFTYTIWIGLGVLGLFRLLRERVNLGRMPAAVLAAGLVLTAPVIMGFQNFDDHSRRHHSGARDYASNFLNSCEENAIIFTYGDNDTYPLWYAQEVEGIRRDVRVVNLSLIAVDWYIQNLRRKINDSAPIKMTVPLEALRGMKRIQLPIPEQADNREMSAVDALRFIAEDHPFPIGGGRSLDSYVPARNLFISLDLDRMRQNGAVMPSDTGSVLTRLPFRLEGNSIIKDELAVLDIIASNINDRPIYFAVTCQPDKLLGLQPYMSLEGLALRITPVRGPGEPAFGIIGSGRCDADKILENVSTRWRWGNFDQEDLFVDQSYTPSIQSQRYALLRAAREFLRQGRNEKAIEIMDIHFQAFPHMNFPYGPEIMPLLMVYIQANAYEKAKPHFQILAGELEDWLTFYYSLDVGDLDAGFSQDFAQADRTKDDLMTLIEQAGDTAFAEELRNRFAPFAKPGIQ